MFSYHVLFSYSFLYPDETEESDPNEELGAGISESAPSFRLLSFQYISAFSRRQVTKMIYHQFLRINFVKKALSQENHQENFS